MTAGREIHTDRAPGAIGPYSQAIDLDGLVFTAGQIGLDPDSGEFAGPDVESQTRQVMANLAAVLDAAGAGFEDVVKTTVYLADMDEFEKVNRIYGEHFEAPFPARSTVEAGRLPRDARVEIDVVARRAG